MLLTDRVFENVNPLSVSVQSSGKKRLILDLRLINKHLWKQSIKFEDLRVALNYLKKGYFKFSFGIKSGYHHVPIFPPHQSFLGFSWFYKGKTRYVCFRVLPLGSPQPLIFSPSFSGLSSPLGPSSLMYRTLIYAVWLTSYPKLSLVPEQIVLHSPISTALKDGAPGPPSFPRLLCYQLHPPM